MELKIYFMFFSAKREYGPFKGYCFRKLIFCYSDTLLPYCNADGTVRFFDSNRFHKKYLYSRLLRCTDDDGFTAVPRRAVVGKQCQDTGNSYLTRLRKAKKSTRIAIKDKRKLFR